MLVPNLPRLLEQITLVCPVDSVQIISEGNAVIQYASAATQQQRDAADSALAAFDWSQAAYDAWEAIKLRALAKQFQDDQQAQNVALRVTVKLLVDELNVLRQWLTSFKAETAAATSLADLKARVATLPNTPDRTYAQAKTAINNLIDGE